MKVKSSSDAGIQRLVWEPVASVQTIDRDERAVGCNRESLLGMNGLRSTGVGTKALRQHGARTSITLLMVWQTVTSCAQDFMSWDGKVCSHLQVSNKRSSIFVTRRKGCNEVAC